MLSVQVEGHLCSHRCYCNHGQPGEMFSRSMSKLTTPYQVRRGTFADVLKQSGYWLCFL